jgi:hypothetical protein
MEMQYIDPLDDRLGEIQCYGVEPAQTVGSWKDNDLRQGRPLGKPLLRNIRGVIGQECDAMPPVSQQPAPIQNSAYHAAISQANGGDIMCDR